MIESLHLENFKCFRQQSFKFASLNLLSGINGLGKSSVIQSLLAIRQSYHQRLLPQQALALNGDLVQLGNAGDVLHEAAQVEEVGIALRADRGTNVWKFNYDRENNALRLISSPVKASLVSSSLLGDEFQYLKAERLGPRMSYEVSDFRVRQHRELGTQGEFTAHFLSVYGEVSVRLPALTHKKAVSNTLRDQVEAWMNEISPGVQIRVSELPRSHGVDVVTLQYSYVYGKQVTNAYRSTNVGFGVTYTLPIVVALLSAQRGSLILIENPEAHLHPRGQAKIGELLALASEAGVQLVVETHSDHVLNGARIAVREGKLNSNNMAVFFFERRTDGRFDPKVEALQVDGDGRIDRWPNGFFDEWDRSLERLL